MVSNSLDPDQDRQSVGPDLGPNCLQMLSADDTTTKVFFTVSGSACPAEVRKCLGHS